MALKNQLAEQLRILKYFPDFDTTLLEFVNGAKNIPSSHTTKSIYDGFNVLEFYGDSILDTIIVDLLRNQYNLNTTAGILSKHRDSVVSNYNLAKIAKTETICYIHEKTKGCADRLEAIIGAVYYQYGFDRIETIKVWIYDTFLHVKPKVTFSPDLAVDTTTEYLRFRHEYCHKYPHYIIGYDPNNNFAILNSLTDELTILGTNLDNPLDLLRGVLFE